MNIVKLQDDLKNAPDQSLIGYVQNPNGQVPSYLALSELQRRKQMREQSQGNQGQGQQPSVAEQLVSEAQPQMAQGVAGLPVTNVGNEESYAAGGIIAFADGGSTQAYNRAISGSFLGKGLGALDEAGELAPTPGNMFKRIGNYIVDTVSGQRWVKNPYTGELVRAKDVVESPNAGALVGANAVPAATNVTGLMTGELPSTRMDMPIGAAQPKIDTGSAPAPAGLRSLAPAGKAVAPQGQGGIQYEPPADMSNMFPTTAVNPAEASMARYQQMMGQDPMRAKNQERLAAMEARTNKEEEVAPWMALAKAGFGMAAGKSPYALSNIAEGGIEGVKELTAAKERAVNQRDKQFELSSKLAQAERAEQIAAATYGLNSEQSEKAQANTEKIAKAKYKVDRETDIAKGKFEAKQFNVTTDLNRKQMADEASYRTQSLEKDKIGAMKAQNNQAKTVEAYNKARDNAQNYVDKMIASGAVVVNSQGEYQKLIEDQYITELGNVGLAPIAPVSGFKVVNVRDKR